MNIKKWQIFASIFCLILGTILHFTYEWFNYNVIVGLFSTINESVWEHLKLLFFPMLFLTLFELFFFRDRLPKNFLQVRTCGIFLGMGLIVVVFYTLLGVIGTSIDFLNIALFFVAVFFALWSENKQYRNSESKKETSSTAFSILLIFTLLFFVFTFLPPDIGLFWEITKVC